MAKSYTGRSSSGAKVVSAARLGQKSGAGNAFGGYAKVKHSNGNFSMRPTRKSTSLAEYHPPTAGSDVG